MVSEGTALELSTTRSTTRDLAGATRRAGEGDSRVDAATRRVARTGDATGAMDIKRRPRAPRNCGGGGEATCLRMASEAAEKVILRRDVDGRFDRTCLIGIRFRFHREARPLVDRKSFFSFKTPVKEKGGARAGKKLESRRRRTRIDRASARPTKPSEGRSTRHRTLPRGPFEPVAARR